MLSKIVTLPNLFYFFVGCYFCLEYDKLVMHMYMYLRYFISGYAYYILVFYLLLVQNYILMDYLNNTNN